MELIFPRSTLARLAGIAAAVTAGVTVVATGAAAEAAVEAAGTDASDGSAVRFTDVTSLVSAALGAMGAETGLDATGTMGVSICSSTAQEKKTQRKRGILPPLQPKA